MPLLTRPPGRELLDLVAGLGGLWHGRTAIARCPAHDDRTPSLSLRQGDRGILVTCFAGCRAEEVLRRLRDVRPVPSASPPTDHGHDSGRPAIDRLWADADPATGRLARAYLDRRGFAAPPPDVRFTGRCPWGPRPRTVFRPALLVAVRSGHRLVALQRIFLDPRTARAVAKPMLGRPLDGAWRGRGGGAVLALAEGFETAEAFHELHGIPCWASLGARRLDAVTIPADVATLLIAADNDPEGRAATAAALARYARPGLEVRPAPPPARFDDWAAVLEERRERGGGTGG